MPHNMIRRDINFRHLPKNSFPLKRKETFRTLFLDSPRIELVSGGKERRSVRRSSIWHHNGSQSPQGGGADRSSSHDEDAAVAADASLYALEAALSFFRDKDCNVNAAMRVDENGKRVVDVTKLRARERRVFIEKLIKCIESDNLRLLKKIRKRIDK